MKQEAQSQELELNKQILHLQTMKDQGFDVDVDLFEASKKLRELLMKSARGAYVRSRAQWMEEGVTSSRYFHQLEKFRAKDKLWDMIYDQNGQEVKGIQNIMNVQHNFYERLYSSQRLKGDCSEFLTGDKSLSQEKRSRLEEPLDKSELKQESADCKKQS